MCTSVIRTLDRTKAAEHFTGGGSMEPTDPPWIRHWSLSPPAIRKNGAVRTHSRISVVQDAWNPDSFGFIQGGSDKITTQSIILEAVVVYFVRKV